MKYRKVMQYIFYYIMGLLILFLNFLKEKLMIFIKIRLGLKRNFHYKILIVI